MCFPASARLQLALPITVTRHRHVRIRLWPICGVSAVIALSPSSVGRVLLPNVSHLVFKNISNSAKLYFRDETTPVIKALDGVLDERYRCHKLTLASITFKACTIDASSLAYLRAAGRWGGRTWVDCTPE